MQNHKSVLRRRMVTPNNDIIYQFRAELLKLQDIFGSFSGTFGNVATPQTPTLVLQYRPDVQVMAPWQSCNKGV